MILDPVAEPEELWPYAERYLGVGTRRYSRFSADLDVAEPYHPQLGAPTFELATFWVPDGDGTFLTSAAAAAATGAAGSALIGLYRRGDRFLLPVHPQTFDGLADPGRKALADLEPGPPVTVSPSANVRTVFVWRIGDEPVQPHFVKLHYPRRLSRFTRRLRRPIIELQLWVSAELSRAGAPYLPELAGGVWGEDPVEAWGFIVRAARISTAGPSTPAWPRFTVPFFALYGRDVNRPDDPTLLEQLVRGSGETPADFVLDRVTRPAVRLWVRTALSTGLALEMHGQNTLFHFTPGGANDGVETAVGYRDCGVYVDPGIRAERGLTNPLPGINVMGRDVPWRPAQVFSLAYDSFLGHHALAFLAESAARSFGLPVGLVREAAADEFQRSGGGDLPLEAEAFYYDDELHPDGGWQLVRTPERPGFR